MGKNSMSYKLLTILLPILICGCTQPKWQEPLASAQSELAILSYNNNLSVTITHIDGMSISNKTQDHFNLIQGMHFITVSSEVEIDNRKYSGVSSISFHAEPNHGYYLSQKIDLKRMIWWANIIDTSTGKIVSTSSTISTKLK
jgi:hypothetical protein